MSHLEPKREGLFGNLSFLRGLFFLKEVINEKEWLSYSTRKKRFQDLKSIFFEKSEFISNSETSTVQHPVNLFSRASLGLFEYVMFYQQRELQFLLES